MGELDGVVPDEGGNKGEVGILRTQIRILAADVASKF